MIKKRYWVSVAVWASIILVLCGMPPQDVDKIKFIDIPYLDKIVHFGLYFVLALLIMAILTLNSKLKHSSWSYVITIFSCLFYGWLIELMQRSFFPGRSYEMLDVVADTAGAVVGVLLYKTIRRLVKRERG